MSQPLQEPVVDLRQLMNPLHAVAIIHRLRDSENTLVRRRLESGIQIIHAQVFVLREAVHTLSDHAQTFLDGILEGTADSHHLAHGLHRTA